MKKIFIVCELRGQYDYKSNSLKKAFYKREDAETFQNKLKDFIDELTKSKCPYLNVSYDDYMAIHYDSMENYQLSEKQREEIYRWAYQIEELLFDKPYYFIKELEII